MNGTVSKGDKIVGSVPEDGRFTCFRPPIRFRPEWVNYNLSMTQCAIIEHSCGSIGEPVEVREM